MSERVEMRVRVRHDSAPTQLVPATLTHEPGQAVVLRFDDFDADSPQWPFRSLIDRLIVESPEPWTLFDLIGAGSTIGTLGADVRLQSQYAVRGAHVHGPVPQAKEINVYCRGLGSWASSSGIKTSMNEERPGDINVEYRSPKSHKWELGNGVQLELTVLMNFKRSWTAVQRLIIEEYPYLTVTSAEIDSVENLIRHVSKALGLFELLSGNSYGVEKVDIVQSESEVHEFCAGFKLPKRMEFSTSSVVVPYSITVSWMESALQRWFQLHELLPLALDLYRGSNHGTGGGAELRFFSAASALESLHGALVPNSSEGSFAGRLRELVDRYGTSIGPLLTSPECDAVAKTRNFIAHQNEKNKANALPGRELFTWSRRLSLTLEAILLAELGLPPELHGNIISRRNSGLRSGQYGELVL